MWVSSQNRPRRVRCRDTNRHAHRLDVAPQVHRGSPRVALALDGTTEPLLLTPLQVGRLRAGLRDCVLAADEQCRATPAGDVA
jgi:hypothetical protein